MYSISGLYPFNPADYGPRFTAYGLHACGSTLKGEDYSAPSKNSLPGGGQPYRGGVPTR
jgi:hypothetical protein